MSNAIHLSKNHGVNPTIPVCFWCGEDKNEVALLGKLDNKQTGEKDIEAPRHCVLDYAPCEKCSAKLAQGVALFEVQTAPLSEGQPPIQDGLYPTGRFGVVSREYADNLFLVPVKERALIDTEAYDAIFRGGKQEDKE